MRRVYVVGRNHAEIDRWDHVELQALLRELGDDDRYPQEMYRVIRVVTDFYDDRGLRGRRFYPERDRVVLLENHSEGKDWEMVRQHLLLTGWEGEQ